VRPNISLERAALVAAGRTRPAVVMMRARHGIFGLRAAAQFTR
jgi:hypothetical protein